MAQTAGQIKPFGFMTLPLTESIYHQYIKRNVFSRRREPGMEMLLSPLPSIFLYESLSS
jgi:hypothetical protein